MLLDKDIWVVGRITEENTDMRRLSWQILGIYGKESDARAACITDRDFVRPFLTNVPVDREQLREIRFPLREKK